MQKIFCYEPEKKDTNYSVLRIIVKGNHVYEINRELKSLEQRKSEFDDVISKLFVSDKFNIMSDSNYTTNLIENINDVNNYIKISKQKNNQNLEMVYIDRLVLMKVFVELKSTYNENLNILVEVMIY
jgi:hypothetical protein